MQQGCSKTRDISLDIIRIIATMAVVMIHCSAFLVSNFKVGTMAFFVGNVFDSVSRLAVPLFVMVSGALFLNEERTVTVKGILKKNIKNTGLLFLFWVGILLGLTVF